LGRRDSAPSAGQAGGRIFGLFTTNNQFYAVFTFQQIANLVLLRQFRGEEVIGESGYCTIVGQYIERSRSYEQEM
jgi:hypothetical protein